MSAKIVLKKPTAAALVAAAPTATPQKRVVVKASAPAAPQKAVVQRQVVSAPKKVVQKIVFVEQEEEEEEAPVQKTPQQIYDEIQVLLAQLVQVSGGKKIKGLKKDGTPRAKRTNNSGWNQFVKEFRAENPGMSWKDAMVAAKADWKALKGEAAPEVEEEEVEEEEVAPVPAPAPAAAKKLVIKKPAAPPAKTAEQILAELAEAKAKAEAEAAAAAAAECPEVEVEEFEWEGQALQKNAQGFCWRVDEEGEQIFVGRWDAEAEKMDEAAQEPVYGSA